MRLDDALAGVCSGCDEINIRDWVPEGYAPACKRVMALCKTMLGEGNPSQEHAFETLGDSGEAGPESITFEDDEINHWFETSSRAVLPLRLERTWELRTDGSCSAREAQRRAP